MKTSHDIVASTIKMMVHSEGKLFKVKSAGFYGRAHHGHALVIVSPYPEEI
jgi:hypothetical protein